MVFSCADCCAVVVAQAHPFGDHMNGGSVYETTSSSVDVSNADAYSFLSAQPLQGVNFDNLLSFARPTYDGAGGGTLAALSKKRKRMLLCGPQGSDS